MTATHDDRAGVGRRVMLAAFLALTIGGCGDGTEFLDDRLDRYEFTVCDKVYTLDCWRVIRDGAGAVQCLTSGGIVPDIAGTFSPRECGAVIVRRVGTVTR